MPAPRDSSAVEAVLRMRGVRYATELRLAIGVSQPTFSRLMASLGDRIVRIGAARATRYALRHPIGSQGSSWPLYRIDTRGAVREAGRLHALEPSAWWFEASAPTPAWLHGEFADGVFPGLPWFLDDLRPQGFMGRAFARTHGPSLGLDADATRWTNDDVIVGLLHRGADAPGDFVVGDRALEQARTQPIEWITPARRAARYAALAEQALGGEVAGSPAGGEQPKFAAWIGDPDRNGRAVFVKFTDVPNSPAGRRWADLLVCEHLAAAVLTRHGHGAAHTDLVESGGRMCLEVTRFDRLGARGRRGVVSLAAHDGDYYGRHDSWANAADRMEADGWLSPADADALRTRWWFGTLIANTDQHFANASVFLDESRPLALAPSYDMLPMAYRPAATGEIVPRTFEPRIAPPRQATHWRIAATMATDFWHRVSRDERVSRPFRRIALENERAVSAAVERFG